MNRPVCWAACSACIMLILISGVAAAQNVPISSLPMAYNGGFAGEAGTSRLASFSSFNLRKFRIYPDKNYHQYFAYDNFFKKIRSGVGFTVGHTYTRSKYDGNFANTSATVAISPKFPFQGHTTLAPFVDFTFVHSRYTLMEGTPPRDNAPAKHNSLGVMRAGLLYNWRHAYLGVSAVVVKFDKTAEALYRFHRDIASQPALDFQGGYTFQGLPNSSITPQIAINLTREYGVDFKDVSISIRHKKYLIGVNRAGFMLGLQGDHLRVQLIQNFHRHRSAYFDVFRGQFIDHNGFDYHAAISLRYIFAEGKQFAGQ